MGKTEQLDAFNSFLSRMDDIARAGIERRWQEDPRGVWAHQLSAAARGADELRWDRDMRKEARQAAALAVGGIAPLSWAAEGAANEIQGAKDPADPKSKGMSDQELFFLPMFGFATPASINQSQAA